MEKEAHGGGSLLCCNEMKRYVNGHALKHFEDGSGVNHENGEKPEKEGSPLHCVCMDCSNYSIFCYRCDEFVVNDTALGQVQKLREHLQNLENPGGVWDGERKRKLQESSGPDNKILKPNDGSALAATGLRNLGNTCFMNAVLQSLSNIEQFSGFFKSLPAAAQISKTAGRMYHTRSQGDTSVSLVEEVRKTLCSLWQGNQSAYSPDSLFYTVWKLMPSFRGYQQQDAHEFMRYLLDHLHRELQDAQNGDAHVCEEQAGPTRDKSCLNGNSSVVTSLFGGVLQNEVNCLICGTESRKFDPFLDLSLDIPRQFRQKKSKEQEPGPPCTLHDCLQSFTDLEELDETELYYCLKCKKRQKSTKKFWIKKLPKVLCLHLKRFHWTTFMRNKVDTYVKFPMKSLDMRSFLLEPEAAAPDSCLYDLAAIAVHHGSGVGSGHYTAYGHHEGRWYHFNDSTVSLTSEDAVAKAKAYILFYVESAAPPTRTASEEEEEEGGGVSDRPAKPAPPPSEATPAPRQTDGDTDTSSTTGPSLPCV
ncbi:ubiquitin carboxyl-terminal hydrolase 3 isoform X2 [Boleophthalmus pectinirostris]|uniref:ubiquitin carboxyl-terminal hydrolase 3 isoform X2 n=1 Tax=Boleophthalmus pectinirostris TaxID=150288 RepID=UPI00242B2BCF|nr:ubiquitin carboxyl-terminal hydrolase 3 isoform X2 [Boleophthalmus pectinirostris]